MIVTIVASGLYIYKRHHAIIQRGVSMNVFEYYESRKKIVDEAVLNTLKEEEIDSETPKGG
jgi:hypothetical protein